ncbi:MAG: DUF2237 domain-containing protein [Zetaproteobacteria bacterium]|nr:DUF2237 domain-containing protein [Zetaproteobacteria bacterium]
MDEDVSVLGTPLKECSCKPMTGFYRNGRCSTGPEDQGLHTVCVELTREFLSFSRARGNDLMTPRPEWGFPGLQPGDHWCLCALRWQEAFEAGKAPLVFLEATHQKTLEVVKLTDLEQHAVQAKVLPFAKASASHRSGED